MQEHQEGLHLELGRRAKASGGYLLDRGLDLRHERGELLAGDRLQIDHDPLAHIVEVGLDEGAHSLACGMQGVGEHHGHRALALRAGDMQGAKARLGVPKTLAERLDALQAQHHAESGERGEVGDCLG